MKESQVRRQTLAALACLLVVFTVVMAFIWADRPRYVPGIEYKMAHESWNNTLNLTAYSFWGILFLINAASVTRSRRARREQS